MKAFKPRTVFGVDFSGAKLAGRNIWISRCSIASSGRLRCDDVQNLERLAGTAEREPALAYLVNLIAASHGALWGMDFPFGLPVELFELTDGWADQLNNVSAWEGGATALGLWCVARAKTLGDKMHIRRCTDTETKTPFDCYHYRIIYQTFHGMRDVLRPLMQCPGTAISPLHGMDKSADRVVVEACPGSTLKRLGLPHNNYKQPTGGPLTALRRRTRRQILDGLEASIDIAPACRRLAMRNPGADALDSMIAAVGAWQAFHRLPVASLVEHARYCREGYVFA